MVAEDKAFLDQVQRILASDELRGSEALRRLLKFLADKSLSGEADELKEYTIAVDGLGKPSSYDPQHNSGARIHVARLRQKLANYYSAEGLGDDIIIDLPKGGFRLTRGNRRLPAPPRVVVQPAVEAAQEPVDAPLPQIKTNKRYFTKPAGLSFASLLWAVILAAIFIGINTLVNPWSAVATNNSVLSVWTPGLEDLWGPFIDSKRPLIVAIDIPLFVRIRWDNEIYYYRAQMLNDWKGISSSPPLTALRSALHDPEIQPSQYYTSFGEVNASFMIGKLLGPRVQNFSVSKTSDLSWQQLVDNNILFVGMQNRSFDQQMKAMADQVQLLPVLEGIRNLHPRPGEPALFADQYSHTPPQGGIVYALVTRVPGPQGNGEVESFTSDHAAGYVAAVRAFVDPSFSRQIVDKLRLNSGGKMPRYFQVLFKVEFRNDVPVETTCVLTRQLP